jgi:hypothetical protein
MGLSAAVPLSTAVLIAMVAVAVIGQVGGITAILVTGREARRSAHDAAVEARIAATAVNQVRTTLAATTTATADALGGLREVADITHSLVNANLTEQRRQVVAGLDREALLMEQIAGLRPGDPAAAQAAGEARQRAREAAEDFHVRAQSLAEQGISRAEQDAARPPLG